MTRASPGFGARCWLRLAVLAAAALGLNAAGGWATALCDLREWIAQDGLLSIVVCGVTAIYVVAMALPFVPGIEIGLALMIVLGAPGVVLVYASTQVALVISFLVGRLVPRSALARAFAALGMERARRLVAEMDGAGVDALASPRWARMLLRRPCLALAALLNLPGNAVIGGAGGIGMLAGASRLLSFPRYVLLIAAATTPVPLVLLLGGQL